MKIKKKFKNIAIIGAGWYGCHLGLYLKSKKINFKIFEKKKDIFLGSSGFNQFRAHLGYHYPRSSKTINEIKLNFTKFKKKYKKYLHFPKNNYYSIAKKKSLIDFETYLKILKSHNLKYKIIKKLNFINNDSIEGVVKSEEGVILNNKLIKFLRKELSINLILNQKIKNYSELKNYDYIIDCTNNTLANNFKGLIKYVLTISFIYKSKVKNISPLTVMDGELPSLYPYAEKKNFFTLTHSKYTHIKQFNSFSKLDEYKKKLSKKKINQLSQLSKQSISKFYKNFDKLFKYKGHFLSYKVLPNENSDLRPTFYKKSKKIISLFSPKISNIFSAEKIIDKYL